MEGSREPNFSKLSSDGPPDHDLYTIPSYTSWFSWNNIHEVERLSLGEFFDGNSITRTPRIYKEYRDFMISKYREDPTRKLTFTEVRKSLVGDICVLQKVFTFLEKWGLINFDPSKPEPVQAGAVEEEEEDEKWRVRVEEGAPHGVRVIAAPNSLKPLAPLPPPPSLGGAADAAENGGLKMPPLASYSDVYTELLEQQKREILVCGNCKESCASGHYEYSKHQEGIFILCEKCFKDGNFDKDKYADDFKFIESGNHQVVWTEAETLLLFESVLKHGDDWDLVAQNVKTKNKLECISKLIQLPFGDLMLGSAHRKNRFCDTNGDVNGLKQAQPASSEPQATVTTEHQPNDCKNEQQNGDNENEEPPTKRRCSVPISGPSSSLMKQVAHISTVVGPWVTSSATEAAVTALCYENQCSREIFYDSDSFGDELESSFENNEQERDPQAEGAQIDKTSSDTQDKSSQKSMIPLTLQMRATTAAALGGAAAHAKLLADQEKREMEYLVSTLVDTQLKKLQRKVKHMEELELIMENQQRQMKELEATILDERLDVLQGIFSSGSAKSRGDASTIIKSQSQNIDDAV